MAAAARLQRYGFDARHLRAIHSAIQREAGLVEQVLAPQLRSANPDRVGAGLEQLDELAGLCAELTESLLVRDLRRAGRRHDRLDALRSPARDRSRGVPHPGRARLPEAGHHLQGHHAAAGRSRRRSQAPSTSSPSASSRMRPDIILGAESRGFILGPALAIRLGVGFAIARKPGKLPGRP